MVPHIGAHSFGISETCSFAATPEDLDLRGCTPFTTMLLDCTGLPSSVELLNALVQQRLAMFMSSSSSVASTPLSSYIPSASSASSSSSSSLPLHHAATDADSASMLHSRLARVWKYVHQLAESQEDLAEALERKYRAPTSRREPSATASLPAHTPQPPLTMDQLSIRGHRTDDGDHVMDVDGFHLIVFFCTCFC